MRIGSLFSGIGGLELGLEWAGLGSVVWQCEIDPFCRAVLAKHWPDVTRFEDVTAKRDYPHADLVCGGFPCQDVSGAGKGAGLAGARSGLWYEFARIVGEVRPRFVVVENVTSGKRRWLPTVRRDLHLLGYRTRAVALSAADVGALHLRRRVFVIADAIGGELREQSGRGGGARREGPAFAGEHGASRPLADADGVRELEPCGSEREERRRAGDGRPSPGVRDPDEARRQGSRAEAHERREGPSDGCWWASEPDVGRVAHGISGGLDGRHRRARLRSLGNAVVPQCAEVVGRIIASEYL
jgi:DNA (cytosine-5)-methyltransferase 1